MGFSVGYRLTSTSPACGLAAWAACAAPSADSALALVLDDDAAAAPLAALRAAHGYAPGVASLAAPHVTLLHGFVEHARVGTAPHATHW